MSVSNEDLEIYFRDLNEEAQQEALDFFGVSSPEEMNWELYPIAVISREEVIE